MIPGLWVMRTACAAPWQTTFGTVGLEPRTVFSCRCLCYRIDGDADAPTFMLFAHMINFWV